MSALPDLLTRPTTGAQYLVSFGKSGGLGVFNTAEPLALNRGDRVVIRSPRGVESGTVLRPITLAQAHLVGAAVGSILRAQGPDDHATERDLRQLGQRVFEAARGHVKEHGLAVEILDVEMLLDATQAIVQLVGDDSRLDDLAGALEVCFNVKVRLENLTQPRSDDHSGGCDKPDCGRNAGGCTSCATGGGCSTCGSSKVDLREYFTHLREGMDKRQRHPLVVSE